MNRRDSARYWTVGSIIPPSVIAIAFFGGLADSNFKSVILFGVVFALVAGLFAAQHLYAAQLIVIEPGDRLVFDKTQWTSVAWWTGTIYSAIFILTLSVGYTLGYSLFVPRNAGLAALLGLCAVGQLVWAGLDCYRLKTSKRLS
jgi:hypothetical protein